MRELKPWMIAANLMILTNAADAQLFEGRLGDNTPSNTCTVSGPNKCTSFYLSGDFFPGFEGITILNNWSIGRGTWDPGYPIPTAHALAGSAGLSATGLSGWRLPTGDGMEPAGALNQYGAIWLAVGNSFTGLQNQFDGVQLLPYWSSTPSQFLSFEAWSFFPGFDLHYRLTRDFAGYAVAVFPGDVARAVPEPMTLAQLMLGLSALVVVVNKRTSGIYNSVVNARPIPN